jgi:hypothetical protein
VEVAGGELSGKGFGCGCKSSVGGVFVFVKQCSGVCRGELTRGVTPEVSGRCVGGEFWRGGLILPNYGEGPGAKDG